MMKYKINELRDNIHAGHYVDSSRSVVGGEVHLLEAEHQQDGRGWHLDPQFQHPKFVH